MKNLKGGLLVFSFLIFSFGTGFVLVTASQKNTEGRSKAAYVTSPTPIANANACIWVVNSHCYGDVVPYWIEVLKDSRCNGTSTEECPYAPVELTDEQQEAVNATLPSCTAALEFAGIACNPNATDQ
jgi:hypothetical protein